MRPELFDLVVGFLELRLGRAPIIEHGGYLLWRTLLAWDCEDVAHAFGNLIGNDRPDIRRHAEAEATQVVVHVRVVVPTTVTLYKSDVPNRSACKARVGHTLENGLAVGIVSSTLFGLLSFNANALAS